MVNVKQVSLFAFIENMFDNNKLSLSPISIMKMTIITFLLLMMT